MRHCAARLLLMVVVVWMAFTAPFAAAQDGKPRDKKGWIDALIALAHSEELMRARAQTIDLTAYPVVPVSMGQASAIFAQGQARGRLPDAFSKVGDCNSTDWLFLYPFGEDQYDLGAYHYLQDDVDLFADSFAVRSYAAHNGLNANAVLDPLWADPSVCGAGESPLQCEYRLRNPSVAIIMFGSNDVVALTPIQFDQSLRRVVGETIQAGVIPVLSTFPTYLAFSDRSLLFNQIVVRIALDYDVPLINLWLALEPLPNHGIDDDGYHLDGPLTRAGDFASEQNLMTGYPVRNLVTLETLDAIRRAVIEQPAG